MRMQLRCSDRRYARDPNYIAFCAGLAQQYDITSSLGIQARMSRQSLGTAESVLQMLDRNDINLEQNMSTIFAKLRGYAPYWNAVYFRN